MSRKIDCPFEKDSWISLPDRWLGKHAARHDEAQDKCREKKIGNYLTRFAISMSLLDDWNLPGLTGNPEQWDYERIDLSVIAWVIQETLPDFFGCLASPETYLKRSGNGPEKAADAETTTNPPGDLEAAE